MRWASQRKSSRSKPCSPPTASNQTLGSWVLDDGGEQLHAALSWLGVPVPLCFCLILRRAGSLPSVSIVLLWRSLGWTEGVLKWRLSSQATQLPCRFPRVKRGSSGENSIINSFLRKLHQEGCQLGLQGTAYPLFPAFLSTSKL